MDPAPIGDPEVDDLLVGDHPLSGREVKALGSTGPLFLRLDGAFQPIPACGGVSKAE